MFTGIQEVLQNDQTSGNALKILTLRIRGRFHASTQGKFVCVYHLMKWCTEDNYICQMAMGSQRRRKDYKEL